jgi:hypothetical protein
VVMAIAATAKWLKKLRSLGVLMVAPLDEFSLFDSLAMAKFRCR